MDQLTYLEKYDILICSKLHYFKIAKGSVNKAKIVIELFIEILQNENPRTYTEAKFLISCLIKKFIVTSTIDMMIVNNVKYRIKKIIRDITNTNHHNDLMELKYTRKQSLYMENSVSRENSVESNMSNTESPVKEPEIIVETEVYLKIKEELEHIIYYELDMVINNILEYVNDIISSNDTILIYGWSTMIENFILNYCSKYENSNLNLILCMCQPKNLGLSLYKELGKNKFLRDRIILIDDTQVDIYMKKCTKVIISCSAILQSGDVMCDLGSNQIAICANIYEIPVIVFGNKLKLAPTDDSNKLMEYYDPLDYLSMKELSQCDCHIPKFDVVDNNLISLFLTDSGPKPSFYIQNLFNTLYGKENVDYK